MVPSPALGGHVHPALPVLLHEVALGIPWHRQLMPLERNHPGRQQLILRKPAFNGIRKHRHPIARNIPRNRIAKMRDEYILTRAQLQNTMGRPTHQPLKSAKNAPMGDVYRCRMIHIRCPLPLQTIGHLPLRLANILAKPIVGKHIEIGRAHV